MTGGTLDGFRRDPEVDEVARKEYMRKNRRRPIEQTVNELGESARRCSVRLDFTLHY